jgi:iron complex outermembrane recepter protein
MDQSRSFRLACCRPGPLCLSVLGIFGAAAVHAQQQTTSAQQANLETVVITGSYIRRTDQETPSPLQVVSAEELHQSGYTSTQQVLNDLTANGQGTLSQSFSGAFATGASGIALRGLNVGATLVLIDGHRSAPYPIGDDGYRSFVDVANLPFDAIERIEVLKDGASAIYGSDAVAGVVNVIMKRSYQGAQVTADGGVSAHADGWQEHLSGIWGHGDLVNDGYNAYLSTEFRKQDAIKFIDRGGTFENRDYSAVGGINANPGAQNFLNGNLPGSKTGYVTDANGNIVGFMKGCNATAFAANQCTYQDTWDQIQPPTENINVTGRFTQRLNPSWTWHAEGSFFDSKSTSTNRPDGPGQYANGYQGIAFGPGVGPTLLPAVPPITIPATNPSFPTGTGLTSGLLRYTFLNLGPTTTDTDAKTYRAVLELNGEMGSWTLDASAGYTQVSLDLTGTNYISEVNLQSALDSTSTPFLIGQANSSALNNFVAPVLKTTDTSRLSFVHLGASDSLFALPGGSFAVAFGADYFDRDQHAVAPPQVQSGIQAASDFSNNFTIGVQRVGSGYFELYAPFAKQFEADAAVRYDHYNLSGGRASPKIGVKFTPIQQVALRGTASRGFRAPGPGENGSAGQSFFAGTVADPVLCPNANNPTAAGNFAGQCVLAIPGLQKSNPTLSPEISTQWTAGLVVEPVRDLSATLDFYSIKIDHQIVPGTTAGVGVGSIVRGTNFAPLPEYQPDGTTVLATPPVAQIAYYGLSYINANTTKTSGFDLGLDGKHQFDFGTIKSKLTWSYIRNYDITIGGVTYKLAGTHGPSFYSGDTGNPKSRVQWSTTFGRSAWEVTGTLNYISSFNVTDPSAAAFGLGSQATCLDALKNGGGFAGLVYANQLNADPGTVPGNVGCSVGHYITYDLYAHYDVTDHLSLHASALNVFNEKAPLDWVTYGGALGAAPWNPSLHGQGAIGQFFTLGATYRF